MESQKTTHILLTVAVVGIFFLIFLYVRDRYFEAQNYQPIVQEESVYIPPTNNPVNPPTTNPTPTTPTNTTPTPTTTPTIQQNISLTVGQNYLTVFGVADEHTRSYKYCGTEQANFGNYTAQGLVFVSVGQSCDIPNNDPEKIILSPNVFYLKMNNIQANITALNNLNAQYGVTILNNVASTGLYTLQISSPTVLNAYTISKIYYDTGVFEYVGPDYISFESY